MKKKTARKQIKEENSFIKIKLKQTKRHEEEMKQFLTEIHNASER